MGTSASGNISGLGDDCGSYSQKNFFDAFFSLLITDEANLEKEVGK